MKVILLEDVPKVGNRYDVKKLKDGFAQNVLITRGLAILATPQALSQLENKKKMVNEKKDKEIADLNGLIKNLANKNISIKVKCNDKGHLFKSIKSGDIISAVKESTGFLIDENNIIIDNIKELGFHTVILKKGKIEGEFKIELIKA